MATKVLKMQQRSDTSTNWSAANPVLLEGEIGIETDTNKMKIGDGITPWSLLPYFNSSTSASDEEIKRIKYYGDPDIIPSDESYFVVNTTGETITGLTDAGKTQTELVIPYEINRVEITTLYSGIASGPPQSILNGSSTITKVTIPKSVTTLGRGAFSYRSSLTSIDIPNSVTSIGSWAFYGCTGLTSVNIPDSVTSIGDSAFSGLSLTSVNIPNSVTSIGTQVFSGSSLTSVNIPNSVTSIGDRAFIDCTALKSITIPNSVTTIGNNAFMDCRNLTIYCEQGSYAEYFANTNNIPVKYTDIDPLKYLTKDNTTEYTPTADYNPATKKYVDDISDTKANANDVYIKTEVDELLNNKAKKPVATTITVPIDGWMSATDTNGVTYYTINIIDSTLTSTGYPITDVVLPSDIAAARLQSEAYQNINKITVNDGSVKLYCFDSLPTVSFQIRIQILYI